MQLAREQCNYALLLPNGHRVDFVQGLDVTSTLLEGKADGLIIEGLWGFNDLGGYGRIITKLVGIDEREIISLCGQNSDEESITIIALASRKSGSTLRGVVLVPTCGDRCYPKFGGEIHWIPGRGAVQCKPRRRVIDWLPCKDFYYNTIYEAIGLLVGFGCSSIAIAGLTGSLAYHKNIGNCAAEAIAHYCLESQSINKVLSVGYGPDMAYGVRYFNEHPKSIGRHREIHRRIRVDGRITKLTIDLPKRLRLVECPSQTKLTC